jgi:hypothetical protein
MVVGVCEIFGSLGHPITVSCQEYKVISRFTTRFKLLLHRQCRHCIEIHRALRFIWLRESHQSPMWIKRKLQHNPPWQPGLVRLAPKNFGRRLTSNRYNAALPRSDKNPVISEILLRRRNEAFSHQVLLIICIYISYTLEYHMF